MQRHGEPNGGLHRATVCVGLICGLMTTAANAAENLIGKKVTVIRWDAEFRADNNKVIGTADLGDTLEVYTVKGNRLFVRERDGFILRADVVPYEMAIKHFTAAVKRKPTSTAYHDRGTVYHSQEKYDEALADFNESLRRDPKSPETLNARGNVYSELDEHDKAIEDYTAAIKLDRKEPLYYSNRGLVWVTKGDDDKAMSDFNDAVRLDPDNANALENRGDVWRRKNENDKAIEDYDRALKLDPSKILARMYRAYLLRAKGDNDKAIADYNEVLRREPKNTLAYQQRAGTWMIKGVYVSAASDFQQALDLEPDAEHALVSLALLRAAAPDNGVRDGRQALELLAKIPEERRKFEYYLGTLAAAHAEAGEFDQAVELETRLVERGPAAFKPEHEERLKLFQDKKPLRLPATGTANTKFDR